jgi:hypothetical protein
MKPPTKEEMEKAREILFKTDEVPTPFSVRSKDIGKAIIRYKDKKVIILAQALSLHAEEVAGPLVEALEWYALQSSQVTVDRSVAKHAVEEYRKRK